MKRFLLLSLLAVAFLPACRNGMVNVEGLAPISVSISPGNQTAEQGQAIMFTGNVMNDSAGKGVTWSASCTPAGSACGSFSSMMTPSGTPTTYTAPPEGNTASVVMVTITATSVADTKQSNAVMVTVNPPAVAVTSTCNIPAATPCPMTTETAAIMLTGTVTNDLSAGQVNWTAACSDGRTPCGSFSASTTPSGTPTTFTTPTFAIGAARMVAHAKGSRTFTVAAGGLTVTITGTLSTFTSFSNATPAIAINPKASATATLVPTMIVVGQAYMFDMKTLFTGGTQPFSWGVGGPCTTSPQPLSSMIPGISLDCTTGIISGTATSVGSAHRGGSARPFAGKPSPSQQTLLDFFIAIFCMDAAGFQHTVTFEFQVMPAALTITPFTLPTGTVGTPYGPVQLSATGGVGTDTWSWTYLSGVPGHSLAQPGPQQQTNPPVDGLTLSSSGLISGTPTAAGMFTVMITVMDSETPPMTNSTTVTINVGAVGAPTITTTSLPTGTVGMAYGTPGTTPMGFDVMATGGTPPYTAWAMVGHTGSTVPPGLAIELDPDGDHNGLIFGTPSSGSAGTYMVDITVTDSASMTSAPATFTIVINAAGCTTPAQNLPCGQYAISTQGFNANASTTEAPVAMAGSLRFNAPGPCTSSSSPCLLGTPSVIDVNIAGVGTSDPTAGSSVTGSYFFDSNNLGSLTLNIAASGTLPAGGLTLTYMFTMNSGGTDGQIIGFDHSGNLDTGFIRMQDTTVFNTSAINGNNYALGFVGYTTNTTGTNGLQGARAGVLGTATASGCAFSNSTGGGMVINNGGTVTGTPAAPFTFTGTCGSSGVDSGTGRGTETFNLGATSPFVSFLNFSFYVVRSNGSGKADRIDFVETDTVGTATPLLSGSFRLQNKTSFTSLDVNCGANLSGVTTTDVGCLVANTGLTGSDHNFHARVELDLATQSAATPGMLSVTLQQHKSNDPFTPMTPISGFVPTVMSSGLVDIAPPPSIGGTHVALVLSDTDKGFFLGSDPSVQYGVLNAQKSASLNSTATTFFTGAQLTDNSGVPTAVGFVTLSGGASGSLSGQVAVALLLPAPAGLTLIPDTAISGSYGTIDSTGFGQGTSSMPGPSMFAFYVTDTNSVIVMETDTTNADPLILSLQAQ